MTCSYNMKCDKCPVYDDRNACPHYLGLDVYIPPMFRPKIRKPRQCTPGGATGDMASIIWRSLSSGASTASQLAGRLNSHNALISYHLCKLEKQGKVKRVGNGKHKAVIWEVVRNDNTNTEKN